MAGCNNSIYIAFPISDILKSILYMGVRLTSLGQFGFYALFQNPSMVFSWIQNKLPSPPNDILGSPRSFTNHLHLFIFP